MSKATAKNNKISEEFILILFFIAASGVLMVVQLVCFALFDKPVSPKMSRYNGKVPRIDSTDGLIKNMEEQLNYNDK